MSEATRTVEAHRRDLDKTASATITLGANLQEAVALFGEEVVFNRFTSACVIDAQARIRNLMGDLTDKEGNVTRAALSEEEIVAEMANWKPGVKKAAKKTAKEKAQDLLAGLDPDARAALLADLAAGLEEDGEE